LRAATNDPLLTARYCTGCHNNKLKTAGLSLEGLEAATIPDHADVWEKVIAKLRTGMMPPPGLPRPDSDTAATFVKQLESSIDRAALARPNPGRTEALHRLNRSEYHNVIRDLLGLEVDVTSLLPPDDASYGFDNIAGVLRISPVLMERYTGAAQKLSRIATGSLSISPAEDIFRIPSDRSQEDRDDDLPYGTRGGTLIRYTFPLDAEYTFKVRIARDYDEVLSTFIEPNQIEVAIDGERVKIFTIGEKPNPGATPVEIRRMNKQNADAGFNVTVPVKAGRREVAVAFIKKTSAQIESARLPLIRPEFGAGGDTRLNPYIASVTVMGPYHATGPGDTPSRKRIFVCQPANPSQNEGCANRILSSLARNAYRRPVSGEDLKILMDFYKEGAKDGGFESGIELALRRMLISPSFLFRIERDPAGVAPGASYHVSDLELASRLSFFLWSSMPDETLLDLAIRGKLHEPAVLEAQVRRMLADSKASALVNNFTGQWLYLRNLPDKQPDSELFPNFDDHLRQDFRRETELFFDYVLHNDVSVLDLLTAKYTFLNERLAKHYGIPNVYGSGFRRVELNGGVRGGLLGQGSILLVTSQANRTSPVVRGKWLLENLLGTPPPPPPQDVPALKENIAGSKQLSVRERLEEHRANPACAGCHKLMDPLGFAMENFDAIGRWRAVGEDGGKIDASGVLVDGTKVDGPQALRQALASQPENFIIAITEKMLTYALGRGLEYYDEPAVRQITRDAARSHSSLSAIIMGIVRSTPFQMRRSQQS
jgi:hypothetical protein